MVSALWRTVVMYAAILLGVRIMGKRQISQLQTSELVVTLLISELAVLPIEDGSISIWQGFVPMAALVVFELLISLAMLKSNRFRKLICGKPVLVVENGKILQNEMRRLRLSTEELFEQLRQNGVFSLEEVAYAIIETNGMMSVARHAKDDALTPKQAGVKVAPAYLEVVVISDGELSESSLSICGKDAHWAKEQVKSAGMEVSDVFLMTATQQGKSRIVKKDRAKKIVKTCIFPR